VLGKCRCCARLCMISEAIRDSGVPEYPETRRAARSLARDRLHKSRALDGVLWTDIIYHSDAICLKSDTRSPHIMPRDRGVSVFCSPGGCPGSGGLVLKTGTAQVGGGLSTTPHDYFLHLAHSSQILYLFFTLNFSRSIVKTITRITSCARQRLTAFCNQ
jgi:hypothetical protein